MLGGVDSEPGPRAGRQREIDARLDAVRARLRQLRGRDWDAVRSRTTTASESLETAQRYAAKAHAAAVPVLAASAAAFGRAAEAHERVASVHERAAADWERAERAQSALSGLDRAGPAAVSDKPGDGVAS